MKSFIYLILSLFLLFKFSLAQSAGWSHQNPIPQARNLTDLVVFNDSSILAVGNYGNMIKTTNNGKDWNAIYCFNGSDAFSRNLSFIDSLNGWYLNNNRTGNTIVHKTSDGGKSWNVVHNFYYYGAVDYIHFVNNQIGFIVGNNGLLLKSTDGGVTWNSYSLDPSFLLNEIFFINPDTGWVVGRHKISNATDSVLILKSNDGGINWTVQFKGIVGELGCCPSTVQFIDELTGFVCGAYNLFLKTTNSGTDWIYHSIDSTRSFSALNFVNPDVGWMLSSDDKIFKTINGGENWFQQSTGNQGELYSIKFSNENNGWAVGKNGLIIKTTDGGDSWENMRKGSIERLWSLSIINENYAWVVGENSTIINTLNSGSEWNYQFIDSTVNLHSIYFTDENTGWTVGENGFIYHTSDGGTNWIEQISQTSSDLNSVYFVNDQLGWIAGDNGLVLNTSDGGTSWLTKQVGWPSENMLCINFINDQIGWVSGTITTIWYYATLYKTTNGGQDWTSINGIHNNINHIIDIFFYGDNYGWMISSTAYQNNNFARTTDGGSTWVYEVLNYQMSEIFFLNENVGWIVGQGVFKTTDGGISWNLLTSFCELPFTLSDVHFISEDVGWVVGRSGSIFKTTNGGITFIEDRGEEVIPSAYKLDQNHPNPFNPLTKIRFSIPKKSFVDIKIYNITGELITILVNEEKPAGSYTVSWDASTYPSGVYFYKMETRDYVETKKMLLIK
jgi:photosystem II stability/assembly factor-like uncharacterized protein